MAILDESVRPQAQIVHGDASTALPRAHASDAPFDDLAATSVGDDPLSLAIPLAPEPIVLRNDLEAVADELPGLKSEFNAATSSNLERDRGTELLARRVVATLQQLEEALPTMIAALASANTIFEAGLSPDSLTWAATVARYARNPKLGDVAARIESAALAIARTANPQP